MCEFSKIRWYVFENFNVKIYFIGLLKMLELLKLLRNFGVCGIHLHHGCMKKKIVKSV